MKQRIQLQYFKKECLTFLLDFKYTNFFPKNDINIQIDRKK